MSHLSGGGAEGRFPGDQMACCRSNDACLSTCMQRSDQRVTNTAQKNYLMTDKELLAAHQSLKHFDDVIWGGKIQIFCDHKNLTFGSTMTHQSQRVLCQKIDISNDYNADFIHIVGEDNLGGDVMSCIPMRASKADKREAFFNLTIYNFDDVFPLDMAYIKEDQEKDEELKKMMSRLNTKQQFARVTLRDVNVVTYQGK
eukprot:8907990-Ditylum_brightwellii.AAC.1